MICPLFFHCMSRRLIFGVVYEVVAHTHVWYFPHRQCMHVLFRIDQLGTWSLVEVRIQIRGGGGIQPQELYPLTV